MRNNASPFGSCHQGVHGHSPQSQSTMSQSGVTKKRRGPNDLLFRKSDSGTMANQNKENQTPDTGVQRRGRGLSIENQIRSGICKTTGRNAMHDISNTPLETQTRSTAVHCDSSDNAMNGTVSKRKGRGLSIEKQIHLAATTNQHI
ncbi:uncharacterized protein LOC135150224 isoform X2 [Daucus carota subsp. sativus]|uniref:uncharacterized protein LOC135150224 isoform X2 n=1 Tax=Daucus carota subsp. sativus TaxID=79200 RepID=UPI0030831CD9